MANSKQAPRRNHSATGFHSKAQFLPMPRDAADRLALRARIVLERLKSGEASRELVNMLAQVVLFTMFVTEAGHGRLDRPFLVGVESGLAGVFLEADETSRWHVPSPLIDVLTALVNEYDRILHETRLEVIARADERLLRQASAALA